MYIYLNSYNNKNFSFGNVNELKRFVTKEQLIFTKHAKKRLDERNFTIEKILEILQNGIKMPNLIKNDGSFLFKIGDNTVVAIQKPTKSGDDFFKIITCFFKEKDYNFKK